MAYRNIEDLPPNIKRDLANILDSRHLSTVSWRSLIQLMPPIIGYQRNQIETFALAILQPNGSPTRALLDDLANKNMSVQQLIIWIQQLHLNTPTPQLQTLLALLQEGKF
jgi:hypothetical protein